MNKQELVLYYKDWLNKKFDELRLAFHGRCWKCGATENLQFAHTTETNLTGSGRGKKKRYFDIKNNPFCYALLCEPCHREFDQQMKGVSQ